MIHITPTLSISEHEIRVQFIHAAGPGGQNVNKVATAVQLRFDAMKSPSLPDDVRIRLAQLAGRRMTREGVLIIQGRRFRTQEQNRRDAMARLIALLRDATEVPKVRRETKPPLASKKRRLETKRRRSATKRLRRQVVTNA